MTVLGRAGWIALAFGLGAALVWLGGAPPAAGDTHEVASEVVSVAVRVVDAAGPVEGARVALWFATGFRYEHRADLEVVPLGESGADGRIASALARSYAPGGERVWLEVAAPRRARVLRAVTAGRIEGDVALVPEER